MRAISHQSSTEKDGISASPNRGSSGSGRFIAARLPSAFGNIQPGRDNCTKTVVKPYFRLPHFRLTGQKTVEAFVPKEMSTPPHLFSAVHLPQLVDSPHFGSTHQGSAEALALEQISSDKP